MLYLWSKYLQIGKKCLQKIFFLNCRAALSEKILIFASEYRAFDHINYNLNER